MDYIISSYDGDGECAVSLSSHGEFIHVYERRVGGLVHAHFS